MKRLIMFTLPLLLMIGISNAQVSEWKSVQLTWSDETTQTILQDETKYSDAILLVLTVTDPSGQVSQAGVVENEKFPSKLSFEIITAENTGDSSDVIHTLQFSGDGTTYFDAVVIDTSLSITTANETYAMFEAITNANFPDIEYARVKSYFDSGITDTVDMSGWVGLRYTK